MASTVAEEAFKQIIREFGEEIAEAGVKKVVEGGAKEAFKKVASGGIKGAASVALEARLIALGKQAISKEAARKLLESLATTNPLLTSVTAQQATGQTVAQLMNSGGKSMTEAVGKSLIAGGGKGLGKDLFKNGAKSMAKQAGKKVVIFTRFGVIIEGIFVSIYLVNDLIKYSNGKKSGTQVAKSTASNAAETVGSMVGAGIGQYLIPIPVVGAFVGGAVGATAVNLFKHFMTSSLNTSCS